MALFSQLLILFVAVLHLLFLILEMFLWTKPIGLKVFRQSQEPAQMSRALAANQGLYNGFLSVGLVFGVFYPHEQIALLFCKYFLYCVVIAGFYGAYSVNRRIFFIQALPAILALISLYLS